MKEKTKPRVNQLTENSNQLPKHLLLPAQAKPNQRKPNLIARQTINTGKHLIKQLFLPFQYKNGDLLRFALKKLQQLPIRRS